MYRYDAVDQLMVEERVAQFRGQMQRFLAGELTDEQFLPLRLQNGLYIQRHAPMLRIAVPYGMLSSAQLRMLARIAREYDRGYGHFTTRHNCQFNWPKLEDVPDILALLASVQMHAIQTSGNCVRNTSTDHLAGVAADEIVDPRPYCELMRQWSTFNPEFAYLPRKFKVAFNGAAEDRAAIGVHDLAFELSRDETGEVVMTVRAGGGQGRTPRIGPVIKENLPWREMLTYTEAVLRAYNRWGRRDNKWKARIKILVEAIGAERFSADVEDEWQYLKGGIAQITDEEFRRIADSFVDPPYLPDDEAFADVSLLRINNKRFDTWLRRNVVAHKRRGYAAVTLSLKRTGPAPGDATDVEMDAAAELADRYSFGELRVSHHQNLVLTDVARKDLFALWQDADKAGFAEPNVGLISDIISCPGGDFCSLANARAIPIATAIQQRFSAEQQEDIGELSIKISGCINSCGHHHVGHIGVLGVDKNGEEWYQVLVGGRSDSRMALGEILGRAVKIDEVPNFVEKLVEVYRAERLAGERFIDTAERIGVEPFRAAVYPPKVKAA
ncbi:MAG: nitrite/sulfite reductase [Alphaproteobacteria bacterium]|nr:nitrite/sulfite reductase [Alphaproteobacteria bacterium]